MAYEFELVKYSYIPFLHVFVNEIRYRNPHMHAAFEFGFVLDGCCELYSNGVKVQFEAGDLMILNPQAIHEIRTNDKPVRILFVQYAEKMLPNLVQRYQGLCFDQVKVERRESSTLFCKALYLGKEYFAVDERRTLHTLALFLLLIDEVLLTCPHHLNNQTENIGSLRKINRLNRLIGFVDEHYRENIRLQDFAEQEGLSLSYLSRFVKENLQYSFQDYVKEIRFQDARLRLQNSDDNITNISYDVGFSDPRYMNEIFQERFDMSPGEYRKRFKQDAHQISTHDKYKREKILDEKSSLAWMEKYLKDYSG